MSMFCLKSFSQIELKTRTSTFTTLFNNIGLNVDIPIKDNLSLEASYYFNTSHQIMRGDRSGGGDYNALDGRLKYYFNPEKGTDKWYLGLYIYEANADFWDATIPNDPKTNISRNGIGLQPGYKWILKRNILIELGINIGIANTYENAIHVKGDDPLSRIFYNQDFWPFSKIGYRFGKIK